MKRLLLALVLAAFLLPADPPEKPEAEETPPPSPATKALHAAHDKYIDALNKAQHEYRQGFAAALQHADRIDVFLLDPQMKREEQVEEALDKDENLSYGDYLSIYAYRETYARIRKRAAIDAASLPKWRAALQKMIASNKEGEGYLCHLPIHGIRVFAGDKELFETSLCWQCNNYFFSYPMDTVWITMGEDAEDLKKLLHGVMPISESDVKRIERGPAKDE